MINHSRTLNRYAYVNGNPISYIDPFGLSAETESQSGSDSNSGLEDDTLTKVADIIHKVLGVAGLIPGTIGVAADAINAVLYLIEGDYENFMLSAVCMIGADIAGKGLKYAIDRLKGAGQINKMARLIGQGAAEHIDESADDITDGW